MKSCRNLFKGVAVGLAVGVMTTPAVVFASTIVTHVPEPTTMSIFAVASAGAAIAYRLFRRK